ncbi:MAG TPA: DUF2000 domain-containing protein [Ktedonobacterales bacterium]|nr:DUF2000 domain-containing protein [Ktedonobacterales bacterium]
MRFDTKIAVIVRADLPVWQQLNMTAFLASGIAATVDGVVGQPYEDATGVEYLPMFRQPVLVFGATAEQLRVAYERARQREVRFAVFTDDLFETGHDEANRAAVKAWPSEQLRLAGMAVYADRKIVDAIVKGLALHD